MLSCWMFIGEKGEEGNKQVNKNDYFKRKSSEGNQL